MKYLPGILLLTLCGCATIKECRLENKKGDSHYIIGVSLVRQKVAWCGPASLAMVLQYYGEDITQEAIAREVFLARRKLTLNSDMERYARESDFWTETDITDLPELKEKLRMDIPMIVLLRIYPMPGRYHYVVLTGYDDEKEILIAHAGGEDVKAFSYAGFLKRWKGAKYWSLVIVPSEKVTWTLSSAEEYNRLGLLCEKEGRIPLAIKNYLEAVKMAPQEETYYLNLGNAYLKTESYHEAINAYLQALGINPDSADACNNLAWSYIVEGENLDQVIPLVEKALNLNPEGRAYYLDTLGFFYYKKGDYKTAERLFNEALSSTTELSPEVLKHISNHLSLTINALNFYVPCVPP